MWRDVGRPRAGRAGSRIYAPVAHFHASRNTTLRDRLSILRGVSESFGERLRTLRTRRQMTPSALAHAVGVTEGAIRQMESGQTKSASFLIGLRLADVLGVTPVFLATGREKISGTGSPSPDRSASILERLERLERHILQIAAIERRVKALEGRRRGGTRRKTQE